MTVKTHSERAACIKDSGRYYIVFALSGYIILINIYLLYEAGYNRNCSAVKRVFLKPQKPPLYALVTPLFICKTRETIKEKRGLDKRVIMSASSVSWLDIIAFFSAVILTEWK